MSLYAIGAGHSSKKKGSEGTTLAVIGGLLALILLTPLTKKG